MNLPSSPLSSTRSATRGFTSPALAALAVAACLVPCLTACRQAPPARPGDTGVQAPVVGARADRPPARNLIIYLVDTLRADHLGAYGYGLPTSPRFDEFARGGVLFEQAVTNSSWTRPAVASLLTGLGPQTHGANQRQQRLEADVRTLAEMLADRDFATAAWVANPNLARKFGFRQGHAAYSMLPHRRDGSEHVLAGVRDHLAGLAGRGQRFFLYLHCVDPHAPYRDAVDRAARFGATLERSEIGTLRFLRALDTGLEPASERTVRELLALYDAEVAKNDDSFGQLLDLLAEMGLDDETAVLFVSDHGEEFGEHGQFGHGKSLYDEVLRIPVALRLPGGPAGRRIEAPVSLVDVVPTMLAALGVEEPKGAVSEGLNLLPYLDDAASLAPREIVSWLDVDGKRAITVRRGRFKLVLTGASPLAGEAELYDLEADPGESRDLAAAEPAEVASLVRFLRARERAAVAAGLRGRNGREVEMDDALRRDLRALGYLP